MYGISEDVSDKTYALGQPQLLLPVILAGLIFAAILSYGYWKQTQTNSFTRVFCFILKLTGFAILAFCLLEPLLTGTRPTPGENVFVVLADRSQSLNIKNNGEKLTRGDILTKTLDGNNEWQVRLAQDFDMRRYWIGKKLESVDEFAVNELDMDQPNVEGAPAESSESRFADSESRLKTALTTIGNRLSNRPVAGVLFFTDGNATDFQSVGFDETQLPPIYPVIQGNDDVITDLEVEKVSVSQTNFEAAPISVSAELVSRNSESKKVIAELIDATGAVVDEQVIDVDGRAKVVFKTKPTEVGVHFYTVAATYAEDLENVTNGDPTVEGTLNNNSKNVVVDRGGGPYRVLYVSGRPNWEFKFLNRAIAEDAEVNLVGLIRIAKEKPKFDFRRKGASTTSEFFKGFDKDEEEAEQYFEPVLLRLGTIDENELRGGFPKTAEELFKYDAVICDDVESKYFTFEQMSLIKRFVGERGGGFLMLGGQESFSEGKYIRTPIADLLPVYVSNATKKLDDEPPAIQDPFSSNGGFQRAALPEVFRFRLSRTGQLQPWIRLRGTEKEESDRLSKMPNFASLNRVSGIKPGADELAFVGNPAGKNYTALVTQNYGTGRSGALLVGDFWRWGLNRSEDEKNDLASAWRQTIRWLVADVPRRVEVNVSRAEDILSDYQISIMVRNEEFLPLDNAELEITVTDPNGKEFKTLAQQNSSEAGKYDASFPSLADGNYIATVVAKNPDGTIIETRQAGWVCASSNEELQSLQPNRKWLTDLAKKTGGEVIENNAVDEFVQQLPNRKLPMQETAIFPLWHHMAFFWIAIACLASEWGIRRLNGLP